MEIEIKKEPTNIVAFAFAFVRSIIINACCAVQTGLACVAFVNVFFTMCTFPTYFTLTVIRPSCILTSSLIWGATKTRFTFINVFTTIPTSKSTRTITSVICKSFIINASTVYTRVVRKTCTIPTLAGLSPIFTCTITMITCW